ncbi:MAG: hypothetical protein QM820_04380 [Minicystis sp.]
MVTPFRTNARQYALYRLLQNGLEVGWVYASGGDTTRSTEVWQLYTGRVTGAGRGAYTWPSYQDLASGEATSVKLEFVFVRTVDGVSAPDASFTEGAEYRQLSAPISSP